MCILCCGTNLCQPVINNGVNIFQYALLALGGLISGLIAKFRASFSHFFKKPENKVKRHHKRRGKIIAVVIVLACVVIGLFFYYFSKPETSQLKPKYSKVLIIGIDGMDPAVTKALMDKGLLNNFKRLADKGAFANLNSSNPPETPVAWTSIATGTNPGQHNIFDYIERVKGTYLPILSITQTSNTFFGTKYISNVKAESFWDITSRYGIDTNVIRWPVTFPPEKINGDMLSGLGTPDIRGFLSGYTIYSSEKIIPPSKSTDRLVIVDMNSSIIRTEIFGPNANKGNGIETVSSPMIIAVKDNSAEISVDGTSYNLSEKQWSSWIKIKFDTGLFSNVYGISKAYLESTKPFKMYLTTINIDPSNPVVDISSPMDYSRKLADNIGPYATLSMPEETDGYVDGAIDKVAFTDNLYSLEKEKEDMFWERFSDFNKSSKGVYAFVFDASDRLQHVITDKGENLSENYAVEKYYSDRDEFLGKVLDNIDNRTLLLIMSDHGFSTFDRAVNINNWLVENGYMTLKMDNGPSASSSGSALFRDVDWSRTRAYSLGFSSIYINLKGREPQGIVEENDKEQLEEEIISKLKGLKYNGSDVFHGIYKGIYNGKYQDDAPDLIAGFNPGFRMSSDDAVGGLSSDIFTDNDNNWNKDHLIDPLFVPGVLFSNAKLDINSASQLDIAPTVLDALGISQPQEMEGKSLLKG